MDILVLLITFINCAIAGSYVTMALRFSKFVSKLDQFEVVAKAASESNKSIADRVLELGDRVNNVQQYLNATQSSQRKF